MLLEACAGLLDSDDPEETIRREVEEETGFRIGPPRKLFELYMSPGSVTEKLFFFVADMTMRTEFRSAEETTPRGRISRSSN